MSRAPSPIEATIVAAEIEAGHDGSAELVVTLRYGDGSRGPVSLDEESGLALMQACGIESLDGLVGHSWRKILEGV